MSEVDVFTSFSRLRLELQFGARLYSGIADPTRRSKEAPAFAVLARWSRTTPTRQGALHDPSRWAPRRRPVDDGRLRRCRERGRNPVLKSGHPWCWRSEECRRIAHEAATKAAAMPKAATGKGGSRSDHASRRQHNRKNASHDRYPSVEAARLTPPT